MAENQTIFERAKAELSKNPRITRTEAAKIIGVTPNCLGVTLNKCGWSFSELRYEVLGV